jgi:hypothetical protein
MRPLAMTRSAVIAALTLSAVVLTSPASMAVPAAARAPRPLGAVLTVPTESLGEIVAANADDHVISVLQVSHLDLGAPSAQVMTIRISPLARPVTSRSGATHHCWMPRKWLWRIEPLNGAAVRNLWNDLSPEEKDYFREVYRDKVVVEVTDTGGVEEPSGPRLLLMPLKSVTSFRTLNRQMFRVVHVSNLTMGGSVEPVAVVAVSPRSGAECALPPSVAATVRQLNGSMD